MQVAVRCGTRAKHAISCLAIVLFLSSCGGMESGLGGPSFIHHLSRPSGAGPFPAVILLHTCGGVQQHLYDWARRLRENGYAALIVDSLTPRGYQNVCTSRSVSVDEVTQDAFAARDHLRAQPFVDKDRISLMGFSYGGMAALLAASPEHRQTYAAQNARFRAVASFYPRCTGYLRSDVDTPIHVFIGEADDETPAHLCDVEVAYLKDSGRPVSIKVYPGVTHAFDESSHGTGGRMTPRGFFYRYNPKATEDAAKTVIEFLARHMK